MPKLGLALSGGGTRLAAHIGVIKALESEKIKIDYISGTSGGSIVATLYASGFTANEIFNLFNYNCTKILDYDKKILLKLSKALLTKKLDASGLVKGRKLQNAMYMALKSKNIYNIFDVKMPLAIPAVNIKTGQEVYYLSSKISENNNKKFNVIYREDLASIVRASCSIPLVFAPKKLNDLVLVDGGILVNTPVSILKSMGAEKVIAVSFGKNADVNMNLDFTSIIVKTFFIMSHKINEGELNMSDLVIEPKVKSNSLFDCKQNIMNFNAGYVAVKSNIEKIQKIIKG